MSNADNLYEFSIDGGVSYPYISLKGTSKITIDGLDPGVYNVWVRNGNDSYPVDLGPFKIYDAEPFATVSSRNATCIADGNIVFLINDLPYAGEVQISVDSGINYVYTSSPGIWKDTITGLSQGDYPVWIRYEDETCPVELARVSISTSVEPVEVYPILDGIQITDHPDTLYACPGNSLYLFCFPSNNELVWSISGPDGFSSNSRTALISSSLTKEKFGNYEISYRSPNGCELFKTFVLLEDSECETNAIRYNYQVKPVELYPNPVNDQLTITNHTDQRLMLDVVDLSGSVKHKQVIIEPGDNLVDLTYLPDGSYVFILSDGLGNKVAGSIITKGE